MEPVRTDNRVSVVIPCYNYARFLPDCVGSVRDQGSDCDEIIVVNDGSTDDTSAVCEQLNVTYVRTVNMGESHARNIGIRLASSPLIMCLDADDLLPPGALVRLKSMAGVGVVAYGAVSEFGERSRVVSPLAANFYSLFRCNCVYHNAVFHRSDWEAVGGFDESELMRRGYEDWDFWLRLAARGVSFRATDSVILCHRVHSVQQTKVSVDFHREECAAYVRSKHYGKLDRGLI